MKDVRKVRVNNMDNGFWMVPTIYRILTPKSRNYAIKHAWTLIDLIEKNDFQDDNILFSFNGDNKFQLFNLLLKYRGYDFQLSFHKVEQMHESDYIDWEIIPNLLIRFNYKTIKTLYAGYVFFFTKKYFEYLYESNKHHAHEGKVILEWSRFGFHAI
ncbi:hypothetical protein NPA08_01935 [Mycoplasmopsis citelli]|uniref:Uncharacterized protein n=1 Tax=Mycoplasmopsis citelli TaxID=171281 RepID=A0A449B0V5_9BACT|nr:hypothetical protein [Mycoplasmopsis citelli]UUD36571.1 hypothetical protein NPA08_01935 [Mycoplasmopsis citelli]VEU74206.1 Uncharacterised protein [Mycoplasmopsis citelli]